MIFWAIVPVKSLDKGKSRLAGVFTPQERRDLNYRLLKNTLETLNMISGIEEILVISQDPEVLLLAEKLGTRTTKETGEPDLNDALEQATLFAKAHSAQGILIVPADLPLINLDDVNVLLKHAGKTSNGPTVIIAPDRRWEGTNAMLVCPTGLIPYKYGTNSFERHCQLAREVDAHLEICELPSLALDLDIPDDLDILKSTVSLENTGGLL